ncbi:MAG: histidine kinase dimerization/phosphoacceptor domain -containing protein [Balneolaceae bacterium]
MKEIATTHSGIYKPLTMDYAIGRLSSNLNFWGLFVIWISIIALTISSVFIVESFFGFSDILNQDKIGQVFLIQIPMLIGMLLVFWVGFEWGFIPVFISTFILAFTAAMTWYWALLYSISFTLGLAIYALAYYCLSFDVSLRSLKSFAFYVVVSLFSALACSLGAFIWSRFYHLPLFETLVIWKSWWVSLFLQAFIIGGPLLYFFTPVIYRFREKKFEIPPKKEVSLTWIYSTISVVVFVLSIFIISAKLLGSESIKDEMAGANISSALLASIVSVNESFEIVAVISIALIFFIGIGSIYLVGSWNRSLQTEVNEQTKALLTNEKKLNSALGERDLLLNEIHERVRTNLSMVLAILELQLKGGNKKTNEEILKDSHSLIQSLTIVHESMAQTKKSDSVDLKNYAIKLCNRLDMALRKEGKPIQLKVDAKEGLILPMKQAIPFTIIINELVTNSCTHGFSIGQKGSVSIKMSKQKGELHLKVTDNGNGLPDNFEELKAKGIGFKVLRAFSKQLNANLEIISGDVTSVKIIVPIQE